MSDWFPEIDVPTLPVIDLVTGRPGSNEAEVTPDDLFNCQVMWDFVHIYRLEPHRRRDLCKLLSKLVSRTPELKESDAAKMWAKVAKSPEWPDDVMAPLDEDEDMD